MKKFWIGLLLIGLVLAGCQQEPVPTTQPTLTPETTLPTEPPTEAITEPTTEPTTEPPAEPLVLTSGPFPEVTFAESLSVTGTADPRYSVQIGNETVMPDENGEFSVKIPLEPGENAVKIQYLDGILEYAVTRRYTTAWILHEEGATYGPGALVYAEIFARKGSTVEVSFGTQKLTLEPYRDQMGFGVPEGFVRYLHRFAAPAQVKELLDMGPITFRVSCDGITEEYSTGPILCNASVEKKTSDKSVTPVGYRNVGSGYIVEIVDVNAETFDGQTVDDKSRPYWNYLPKGTVDYGSQGTYYNESADKYYHLLRCGIRVYRRTTNKPYGSKAVVDCYTGTLPDHNEISVAGLHQDGHHTELVLDCLWKAPFYFEQEPQDYRHESGNAFILDDYDATYVDITFCYATVFTGLPEIPEDHPLFSRAELIQNEADHTLRLYLKAPGAFYGWNAFYNEEDQLCFRFLNPQKAVPADNFYGADLSGLRIMIDVGHGGGETGAAGRDSNGKYWVEAERNLNFANVLKTELESIGAEVILNRTDNEYNLSQTERIAYLVEQEPDYCICIHHNSNSDPNRDGFSSWYFTPFSRDAAEYVRNSCVDTGIYTNSTLSWYYYYVSRQTVCPIVLTENGYLSNKKDADKIGDPEYTLRKAKDITQGIVDYYLSQNA